MSLELEDARRKVLNDFHLFNYYVMGYPDINNTFHRELCRSRQDWRQERITLHLEPRGHLKTSILTIGDTAYETCLNPNIRVAIFNAKYDTGKRIIRDIRRQFSDNPRMRLLFPHLCIPAGRVKQWGRIWSDTAFEVPGRTITGESTVTLVSVEGSAVSMHFDKLNYDDMLDSTHVATQEQRDKHWEWFLNSFQLRHNPSESRICQEGTFWHHDDSYSRQIRREKEYRRLHPDGHNLLVHKSTVWAAPGIPHWPGPDSKGNPRFTIETIEATRQELQSVDGTDYIFNCQYLLNPTPADQAILKWGQVRRLEERDIPEVRANYVSVLYRNDKIEGRYDVIILVSVDYLGNLYLRRVWTGRYTPGQLLDDLAFLSKSYALDSVFVDSSVMENTLGPAMDLVDKHTHTSIPFTEVDRPLASKAARILSLEPAISKGHFWAIEGLDRAVDVQEEFDQMSATGSKGHDVILTALADFSRFAGRPHRPAPRPYPPGSYGAAFPWPPESRQGRFRLWNPLDKLLARR